MKIDAGEVIPFGFGDGHAIADEDHRRLERAVQLAAGAQRRLLPEDERLFATVPHEGELRLIRDQPARLEHDRLPVAIDAGRLQPDLLELPGDVGGGLLEAFAPHVPALQRIVGEVFDVRPPARAVGGRL